MVSKTLGYFAFETQDLLKIARLHTLFVERCDHTGNYSEKEIPEYLNLRKEKYYSESIDKCMSYQKTSNSAYACLKYCQSFKPTEFMEYFEIKRGKFSLLNKYLKEQVRYRERL